MKRLLALPCLLLLGCPVAPTQTPAPASEAIPRSEVLEARPAAVLEDVFARGKRGLLPSGWCVAVCTEQLRSQDVPPEALDLVLVALQRGVNAQGPDPEARLRPAVRARLARDLSLQSRGIPGLEAWTEPLLASLEDRRDLICAKVYLERVHVLWRLARRTP